ncbi:hypothetical protein DRN69_08885 [Candidatus Pacearchaeota archaeon]|nr:MAG: hypothetical protein DRN69_08885 [Candidatus Pacearchaeota archaeon]
MVETCGYEIVREGTEEILRVNCEGCIRVPSIEDSPICMMRTIDKLSENPTVTRIVFRQRRFYTYNNEQTAMLSEIAKIYSYLIKKKKALSIRAMGLPGQSIEVLKQRHAMLQYIILNLLRTDPIGAYVELRRLLREARIKLKRISNPKELQDLKIYIDILEDIYNRLDKTTLITKARPYIEGYKIGNRDVYKLFFRPTVTPDFMFTQLMAKPPIEGEQLDIYRVENADVTIYSIPDDIRPLYHIVPPEFKISEDKYILIDTAKTVLLEHKPKEEEFLEPERMRTTFMNIGMDLLRELAEYRGMELKHKELKELAEILVRHTIGFGVIELILKDPKIQDITINAPMGSTPIFLLHQDYDECVTNIIPTPSDGESWATKFRMLSGRPLDEANPVLDTELKIPGARSRVAIVGRPLNPFGLGYAFRRHRDKPWTLPLYVQNRMISPLAAGLLSFLIDGARTCLIAGTRSSGKTSMLGAFLVEIMRKYRIITIEDTLELPTEALRRYGYNIQPLKVRSALVKGGAELSADEGIRTSLRMGDSCLIVGEVRSVEALALYEAMRVGALANVVAGTIHGESPYGVFDRVVNDLGVPRTSFKATNIILVCNPLKSPDGLHKWRRVTQITEVRKHWTEDPLLEGGFVDLMRYNSKTDQLEPTDDLINGNSQVLKDIGGNVKEWAGNWEAIWDNIVLRANIKKLMVDYANRTGINDLLEAKFVIQANDEFHRISSRIKEEAGYLDSKRIFQEFEDWLKRKINKKEIK